MFVRLCICVCLRACEFVDISLCACMFVWMYACALVRGEFRTQHKRSGIGHRAALEMLAQQLAECLFTIKRACVLVCMLSACVRI